MGLSAPSMPSADVDVSVSAPDMPSGNVDASVSVPDMPSADVKVPKKGLFGKFLKKKSSKASVEVRDHRLLREVLHFCATDQNSYLGFLSAGECRRMPLVTSLESASFVVRVFFFPRVFLVYTYRLFAAVHHSCCNVQFCQPQVPDARISVPDVSGSLPEVSGDVSAPSVGGGMAVDLAVPSADVDASAPSASIDVPGECKTCIKFLVSCLSARCDDVFFDGTRGSQPNAG